jgi:GH24 family phage-related lysozyme (muramidase)
MHFKLVTEKIYLDNDDYIIDSLVEGINEGLGDSINSTINKIVDKKKALLNLIKRFNAESNLHNRKRLAKIIVILFITLYGGNKAYQNIFNNEANQNNVANVISNDKETSIDKIVHYFKELLNGEDAKPEVKQDIAEKYNDANTYTTSIAAKDTIKKYEKLVLHGYKIKGDGKITIGWGHAEPIKTSKYKYKQKITKELADKLFDLDVKKAEDGVKRIFAQWDAKGNNVQITQGMFDAMVSIAFNAGIDGLRTSAFIQLIKRKKFKEASKSIIDISNSGKFRGLDVRRGSEQKLYHM